MVKNFVWVYSLRHFYAHTGVSAQAAGAVNVKAAVTARSEAQIAEGGVREVGRRIAEACFELAWQLTLADSSNEVLRCCFGVGEHVKVFLALCAA